MAYATLLSITQLLEQILHPRDQSLVLPETKQQIMRTLHAKASFFLSFLENDSLRYSEPNLEWRIRDVAYEVEAMIESGFPHQNYEMSQKMVVELDSILGEVMKMKERNQVEDILSPAKTLPSASSGSGAIDKTDIVGLHKEMIDIKDRLTGSPSRCEIISIVGMPGIGKTTLAKTLYHDPIIVKHFDVRGWITVSANYNLQQMLIGLLDSIQNISHDSYPQDLALHLHKTLKKRRYLIVMDDVWDNNPWRQVKRFFPDDNIGSRVILTTRLQNVADHVECPDSIYSLCLLSHADSWKLLCQKAFKTEPCPPDLERVGKEIAYNCKGLPLSLVVIGGMLYKAERTLDCWLYVTQNVNWALNDTDDQVMNILSLSYKKLPHHLRACFLYMGVLPEDHTISKSKLIRFWVAEGFIKPTPSKSLEEVAYECLENLIDRNMILVRERNHVGGIKKCGIHDLMRDLCMRIAEEEKFLKVVNSQLETYIHGYQYNFRHIYMHSDSHNFLAGIYGFLPHSLLYCVTESPSTDLLSRLLSSHQLRVLDAKENPLSKLQDETIGLRYISFCCRGESYEVPSLMSKLSNLQTFVITSQTRVILPVEIWMMPQLRHIKTRQCFLPYPYDAENQRSNIVPLENLHTLEGVTNFIFSEDSIRMMPNLKKLKIIFKLSEGSDLFSYGIDKLVLLRQLEALNVSVLGTKCLLWENFVLSPTLSKLTLSGFRLQPKHMASIGSFKHLEELNLKHITFDGSAWEPTEGEFLQLKSLVIDETDLEYLTADETNFPVLQRLRISRCYRLTEIPSEIGYIQTLGLIDVFQCAKSAHNSVKLIKKEQRDFGNDGLQVIDIDLGIFTERIVMAHLKSHWNKEADTWKL